MVVREQVDSNIQTNNITKANSIVITSYTSTMVININFVFDSFAAMMHVTYSVDPNTSKVVVSNPKIVPAVPPVRELEGGNC